MTREAVEVCVESFPDGADKQRVSIDCGIQPISEGRSLFDWGRNNTAAPVMKVDLRLESSGFHAGVPQQVLEPVIMDLPDGEGFLLRRANLDPPLATVIVDWTALMDKP